MVLERVEVAVAVRALIGFAARISVRYDEAGAPIGTALQACDGCTHFQRADPLCHQSVMTLIVWLCDNAPAAEGVPLILRLNPNECATMLCGLRMYSVEAAFEPPELPRLQPGGLSRLTRKLETESQERERRRATRREPGDVIALVSRNVS